MNYARLGFIPAEVTPELAELLAGAPAELVSALEETYSRPSIGKEGRANLKARQRLERELLAWCEALPLWAAHQSALAARKEEWAERAGAGNAAQERRMRDDADISGFLAAERERAAKE